MSALVPMPSLLDKPIKVKKAHLLTLWALALGAACAAALFLLVLLFEEYRDLRLGALMFWLLGVLREFRYVGLFAICYLSAVILPLPAGAVLMAAAFESKLGNFDLASVVVIGIIATVAGDNLGYWLARRYGAEFMSKIGFGRLLRSPLVGGLGRHIDRHPGWAVFLTRFITTAAPLANLLMGIRRVPYRTFLLYDVLGETGEVLMNVAIGVLFEERWEYLYKFLGLSGLIALFLVLAAAVLSVRKVVQTRRADQGRT